MEKSLCTCHAIWVNRYRQQGVVRRDEMTAIDILFNMKGSVLVRACATAVGVSLTIYMPRFTEGAECSSGGRVLCRKGLDPPAWRIDPA